MGTKYGSIHIKTERANQVVAYLCEAFKNKDDALLQRLQNMNINGELLRMTMRYSALMESQKMIVVDKDVVSFFDEDLSFESVAKTARKISQNVDDIVFYTANFSGDIFVFGAYSDGKKQVGGVFGEYPEAYGMKKVTPKRSALAKVLNVAPDALSDQLFADSDADTTEQIVQTLLGIPLNLSEDDVMDAPDLYVKAENPEGIHVYVREYPEGER